MFSFLTFYSFTYIPGKISFSAFLLQETAEIILFAAIIYIFITFSRNRKNMLLKIIIIFIISVPVLFLLFQYAESDFFNKEGKSASMISFPFPGQFYENPGYSLYAADSSTGIIKKGLLISKSSREKAFTEIINKKIREEGKNSFYLSLEKEELVFSGKPGMMKPVDQFFKFFRGFSDIWRKEAGENSILLLFKIAVFMIYILSLNAAFNISIYPVVNFMFYSAASFPVIYFFTIYRRINIPLSYLKNLPVQAGENWGYGLILLISVLFIFKAFVLAPLQGIKKK